MKALWIEKRQLSLRGDFPIPSPSPGEALIRVHLAGVCSTDLELLKGYLPFTGIPGHEFTGEIVSINQEKGPGTRTEEPKSEMNQPKAPAPPTAELKKGKRVVGGINITCGTCRQCVAGREIHCEKRTVLGIIDCFLPMFMGNLAARRKPEFMRRRCSG